MSNDNQTPTTQNEQTDTVSVPLDNVGYSPDYKKLLLIAGIALGVGVLVYFVIVKSKVKEVPNTAIPPTPVVPSVGAGA
jgi:hypothetical protein